MAENVLLNSLLALYFSSSNEIEKMGLGEMPWRNGAVVIVFA
jgi:hypothetical protein